MYVGLFTFLCSATMEQSVLSLNSPPCDFQANLSETSFFSLKNQKTSDHAVGGYKLQKHF